MTYNNQNHIIHQENHLQFLNLKSKSHDFLINKEQITSSVIFDKSVKIKSFLKYLTQGAIVENEKIITFNLDDFVCDLFQIDLHQDNPGLLITNFNGFCSQNQAFFQNFLKSRKLDQILSNNKVALKFDSEILIEEIKIKEFYEYPSSVNQKLTENGLKLIRFKNEKKIQILMDIEEIIFNFLIRKK